MTTRPRWHHASEWALWLLYQPLAFLWLIIAGMSVAAVVAFFSNWRHAVELAGLAGTMTGVLKLVAQAKGIPAWPVIRRDADSDDASGSDVSPNMS